MASACRQRVGRHFAMMSILLSMPLLYLYLVYVGALLIIALWTREKGPRPGAPRPTALAVAGQVVNGPPVPTQFGSNRLGSRERAFSRDCARGPFRDFPSALSADYAFRLDQAIRRFAEE